MAGRNGGGNYESSTFLSNPQVQVSGRGGVRVGGCGVGGRWEADVRGSGGRAGGG